MSQVCAALPSPGPLAECPEGLTWCGTARGLDLGVQNHTMKSEESERAQARPRPQPAEVGAVEVGPRPSALGALPSALQREEPRRAAARAGLAPGLSKAKSAQEAQALAASLLGGAPGLGARTEAGQRVEAPGPGTLGTEGRAWRHAPSPWVRVSGTCFRVVTLSVSWAGAGGSGTWQPHEGSLSGGCWGRNSPAHAGRAE